MSFKNFNLLPELLKAVEEQGYDTPTSVQIEAIPIILEGHDLLAGSKTGTGKTAGFTLPLLQNLIKKNKRRAPFQVRSIILTPTRELAAQVEESVRTYGKFLPIKTTVVFGGVSIHNQIRNLRNGVDVLVATPGRLLDLFGQNALNLSQVEILVLDEADRMLDMGFINDINRILSLLPKKRQNLLFSATFSNEMRKLADGLLNSPKRIQVDQGNNITAEGIEQMVHPVDSKRKRDLLSHLIQSENWKQVLVFTRTKHCANRLSTQLESDGITATCIHGNKSQGARTKALADFKRGSVKVLVATDIAARGLDIDQLPYVVNFELPTSPEDYVHRIGRTGRAGNKGKAISLVCIDEHRLLRDIERLLKCTIAKVVIPEFQPDPKIKPVPLVNGRPPRQSGGGGGRSGRPQQRNRKPGNRPTSGGGGRFAPRGNKSR